MPIRYDVDHEQRLVHARGSGVVTDQDVFGYQREVWSQAAHAGYDELVDMTEVERVALPSAGRIRALAQVSARMDVPGRPCKFAIVAPRVFEYGLGRMYAAYRSLDPRSTKEVKVFRTVSEAMAWLAARPVIRERPSKTS
jgi:hypothetical protein